MKMKSIGCTTLAAAGLLLSGCITNERTVYRDVERTRIEFENEAAARLFYETLAKTSDKNRTENHTTVELPIIFKTDTRVVTGPNEKFNAAVEACDSNHDGKITELEARIFSDNWKAR